MGLNKIILALICMIFGMVVFVVLYVLVRFCRLGKRTNKSLESLDKIVVVDGGAVLSPADPEKFSESSHTQNN